MPDPGILTSWIRATWTGWLLGVPLIIVFALAGEAVGIGGFQVLVGLGMGVGVGFMQARALRPLVASAGRWRWPCMVGLSLPFLTTDLLREAGQEVPYSIYLAVALGGLIAGIWQARLLRRWFGRAGWWVVASVLGWSLAAGLGALADGLSRAYAFRGVWGALAYLGIIAAGGLILGVLTGLALAGLVREPAATQSAAA